MEDSEEDVAEIHLHVDGTPGEPSSSSTVSRVKFSFICDMVAVLTLGLLAGGCMGDVATAMAFFLKEATLSRTQLTGMIPKLYPFITSSYVTYMSLLGASLALGTGLSCGHQVYLLVKKWSQKDLEVSALALALAAHVAVVGVAVTGAAVGALLELSFSSFILIPFSVDSGMTLLLWQTLAGIVSFLICAASGYYYGCMWVAVLFVTSLLIYLENLMAILSFNIGSVIFLDMGTMLPLIPPSLLLCMLQKYQTFQLSKSAQKIPMITIITVLIGRSYFCDKDQPLVPYLDPTDFTQPDLHVLDRFFVLLLGLQMFQASCGAVTFLNVVSREATEISAGAVSFAAAGVLAVIMKVSPMLPAGVLLGGLMAASGGAGAALIAAGDLGHRYGGHSGRAAAALIAAIGAFLPLAIRDVNFGFMVALCAAAIPGSAFVEMFVVYINRLPLHCCNVLSACFRIDGFSKKILYKKCPI